MAERRGASRVVALDNYAWGVDFGARDAYWKECFARGELPDQSRDLGEFWRPELPGRRGFEFAAATLDSKVEPCLADFATADLSEVGVFDVVFYLGVLYHMKEPLTALERVRSVTAEVAVVETQAIHVQYHEQDRLLQLYAGGELNNDFGNWYVPTEAALHSLCRAAGFSSVETVAGPPRAPAAQPARGARPSPRAQRGRDRRGVAADRVLPPRRARVRLARSSSAVATRAFPRRAHVRSRRCARVGRRRSRRRDSGRTRCRAA